MKQQFIGLFHCKCGTSWRRDIGFFERTPDMVFSLERKKVGNKISLPPDKERAEARKDERDGQTGKQYPALGVDCCFRFCSGKFGDRTLDGRGTQRKGKSEHRTDQLIDAHLLRTEGAGEENPVKKADNAAENSGGSQQKSALQQMIFIHGKKRPGNPY